jgi:hypothetical protein
VAVLAVLLAPSLAAQERTPVWGVGISVPDFGLLLPINVSPHFRLEPYVQFVSARADYPATTDTVWTTSTRFGLGAFSVSRPGEPVRIYFGSRVGLLWGSNSVDGPTVGSQQKTTGNGWFAGGVIGGEYRPAPRISVGGEALIEFEHTSSATSGSGTANVPANLFARAWFSSGSVVVRFYP